MSDVTFSPKRLFVLIGAIVAVIVVIWLGAGIVVTNNADTIMVIQSPISGNLTWYTSAGMKMQWWGKVTKYPKRAQFWFSKHEDQGTKTDQSIKVRFNDGAHANISGSLAWYMPLTDSLLTKLHTTYGSPEAIEQQLIRTITEKSLYMTGPLMSSKESYAETRNDLIGYIDDQIVHGVYTTSTRQMQDRDPMTGAPRTISIVEVVRDKQGVPVRQDVSPISQFAIRVDNLSLNSVDYEERVEKQIEQQQNAIQQVQIAIAQSKEAEQKAITAAKNGEANAATAKWEQEVIKAKAVTQAQQQLEVATLEAKTAEQYKQKKIKEAEGDAEYKRKIIVADGALAQKLDTYQAVMTAYAEAIGHQKWVPEIEFNGTGAKTAGGGSSVTELINMLSVKTAKDLALDLSISSGKGK